MAAASTALAGLSACSTNPYTGQSQFILVDQAQLAQAAAASWQELDTCISRARKAHEQGRLNSAQVEDLMEHAIQVSRYVSED